MLILVTLISDAAQLLALLIIVRALLTWIPSVDYGHPVIRAIVRVTDPVLLPIRRLVPPLGGIDVTPIAALLLIQVARYLLINIVVAAFGGG
ncbi:MAG TPA: YggT family protein [bacterium]|nr:YggT family protein [bacterium]